MSLPPFYAAMRAIATSVSGLPIVDGDGEVLDLMPNTSSHWLAAPTAHDTAFTYLDSIMWLLMIHGNAFIVPTGVDPDGTINQTEVVHPTNIVPAWNRAGTAQTFETGAWLDGELLGPSDFIHLKEITVGGWSWGISKLRLLAHAIGLQLSEQAHVKSTYDDAAQPTGYWGTAEKLDPNVSKDFTATLAAAIGGRGNAVTMVPQGIEWKQVMMNHADIQLLEARQWSTSQAASIMGVPPHLIGASTYDTETYTNLRDVIREFEALTVRRYTRIISETFARHDLDIMFGENELAQESLTERVNAMKAAVEAGLCSAEQAAERLGWPAPDIEEPEPAAMPNPEVQVPPALTAVPDD